MDNLEAATPPQKQPELVETQCWECGEEKLCYEYLVCCTGMRFHTCPACEDRIRAEET